MPSTVNKYINSSNFSTATTVYDDINLTVVSPDGFYQFNNEYRSQLNGVLGPLFLCETCGIPCGEYLTIPNGNQGLYQLELTAGNTTNDVGAVLIYFNPRSYPDGIRVLYDGVYYNRLSSLTDGNLQSTSGVVGAFTILGDPNNTCVPQSPNTTSYPFFNGYSNGTWNTGTPSPQNITINSGDDIRGGQEQYNLLVIPKPNAYPGIVTIQVLGPCAGTAWYLSVDCPALLPSFQGKSIIDTICTTADTAYYFARFENASNTYPVVNNPVFSDANGEFRVSDGNYYMDNNTVATVTAGVVSSIVACI